TRRVPMFISRNCEGVVCGVDQTCDESGQCVPATVAPGPPVIPGQEFDDAGPSLDVGLGDAGLDAQVIGMDAPREDVFIPMGADADLDAPPDPDAGMDAFVEPPDAFTPDAFVPIGVDAPFPDAFMFPDAFVVPDAFVLPDAFTPFDAFTPPDVFTPPDAFTPLDAFAPRDAFAPLDAFAPDAFVSIDASIDAHDAGLPDVFVPPPDAYDAGPPDAHVPAPDAYDAGPDDAYMPCATMCPAEVCTCDDPDMETCNGFTCTGTRCLPFVYSRANPACPP
ncbi:MAG: hypothetical protein J0L92_30275, partial [Deltaproteobacteria bacterium]|nr:hypothetical protein [Deltaproteobacteria bacterium]